MVYIQTYMMIREWTSLCCWAPYEHFLILINSFDSFLRTCDDSVVCVIVVVQKYISIDSLTNLAKISATICLDIVDNFKFWNQFFFPNVHGKKKTHFYSKISWNPHYFSYSVLTKLKKCFSVSLIKLNLFWKKTSYSYVFISALVQKSLKLSTMLLFWEGS